MSEEEKTFVDYDTAVKMLPDKDEIHTFRNAPIALIGADWPKKEILIALKEAEFIELTGEQARSMNHGMAIIESGSWLFIETKPNVT